MFPEILSVILLITFLVAAWVVAIAGIAFIILDDDDRRHVRIEDSEAIRRHFRSMAYIEKPEKTNWKKEGF